jgi:hypothetical protein
VSLVRLVPSEFIRTYIVHTIGADSKLDPSGTGGVRAGVYGWVSVAFPLAADAMGSEGWEGKKTAEAARTGFSLS